MMRRLFSILLCSASAVSALTPSEHWRDYESYNSIGVDGQPLRDGQVIQAFDPDGVECGRVIARYPGTFEHYLHVYGDDPRTLGTDEGAVPGDTLSFFVDGVEFFVMPIAVWVAGDRSINRVDLFPDPTLLISGSVRYGATQSGVPGVRLTISGPTSGTFTTSSAGQFMYGPLVEGHYRIVLGMIDADRFRSAITAYDAALILRQVLSGGQLPSPLAVMDVSGDQMVSAFDASIILQHVVGLRTAFPRVEQIWVDAESVEFDHVLGQLSNAVFTVQAVGDVSENWSQASARLAGSAPSIVREVAGGGLAYRVRSDEPVYAFALEVSGPGEEADVAVPPGWQRAGRREGEVLKVSGAGATPLPEGWALLVSTSPRTIRATLNEGIPVSSRPSGRDGKPEPALAVTAQPNPFNPATRILVAVPDAGPVEVCIWSLAGQLVFDRSFDASAGVNDVIWDGADRNGQPVASGVYLCRARQGGNVASLRLLLVR